MFYFKKLFTRKYFTLLIPLLLFSCSTATISIYSFDYPLTSETAKSNTTSLNVKIPKGWFTADDNEYHRIDLWLVKDDYSADLQFTLLNFDSLTRKEVERDGLDRVEEISKDFKIAKYGGKLKSLSKEESFELNKKQFKAYQYVNGEGENIRVVVFQYANQYYELTAIPVKAGNDQELYRIQNSVLSSIN